MQTNLLESASAKTVQTVEYREDVKQAKDMDPLKSLHLENDTFVYLTHYEIFV